MTGPRRGKTRPGRLRRLDRYLRHGYEPAIAALRARPLAVDVGIGAVAHTTHELAQHLAPRVPALEVVGTDIDAARVHAAHPARRVRFVAADLVPPALAPGLVRAFNLLRGFSLAAAEVALARLRVAVAPGGVLVEGTSDKEGRVLIAALYRRDGMAPAELHRVVFSLDVALGFAPEMLRPRCPRTWRGRPGRLDAILAAWSRSWAAVRPHRAVTSAARRAWFVAAAEALAGETSGVVRDPWAWRHGYLAVSARGL